MTGTSGRTTEAQRRGWNAKDGQKRVVIESVTPEIDCGRFPIKRTVGDTVVVEADVFADGHDSLSGVLRHRKESEDEWTDEPLEPLANDRWRGEFRVTDVGRYCYTVQAWIDEFKSWQRGLAKKVDADQDVSVDLLVGAGLVEAAAGRAKGDDARRLQTWAEQLRADGEEVASARIQCALSGELAALMARFPDKRRAV